MEWDDTTHVEHKCTSLAAAGRAVWIHVDPCAQYIRLHRMFTHDASHSLRLCVDTKCFHFQWTEQLLALIVDRPKILQVFMVKTGVFGHLYCIINVVCKCRHSSCHHGQSEWIRLLYSFYCVFLFQTCYYVYFNVDIFCWFIYIITLFIHFINS